MHSNTSKQELNPNFRKQNLGPSVNLFIFVGHKFSGVQGYVWNHRFYGTIVVRHSVLFVEPIVSNNQIRFPYFVPSSKTIVEKKGSLNAYVYKIYSRKLRKNTIKVRYMVEWQTW